MAGDKLLSKWSISVDGVGKAGNAKEYTPPVLEVQTVDFRAGDMDMAVPVEDGMAPMETSFALFGIDIEVLPLFGLRQGKTATVSVRSVYQDMQGTSSDLVEELRGMITKIERDTQDTGSQKDKTTKVSMKLEYYKASFAKNTIVEIDALNGIRNLKGVDELEGTRKLLAV
ncbi:phage major tail tube protein [Shewanella surugensis]|uniref:Phage major tail tube protein n=1 Tax=Shewanella surugensis TaxID=212020 RepID=A0ABT0L901_9GAMM|nr:phage major tail tube protein [Shewanella surugensis]MCL1124166.1 phage major tail tube protein [Shewanella surugensis]